MILSLEDNKGGRAVLLDTALAAASSTSSAIASAIHLPALYLGGNPDQVNELTLTVALVGGEPGPAAGASLQFDFPGMLIDEDKVEPSGPDGWRVESHTDSRSGTRGWVLTSGEAAAKNQATTLRFCFKGLHGNVLGKPLGMLIVTPANFVGLESHRFFGLRTQVALVDAPTGRLRELDLQAEWVGSGIVVPTPDRRAQVENRLSFTLLNPGDQPLVAPELAWLEHKPTFSVHFIYAGDPVGRGALCTEDFARGRAVPPAPAPTLRSTADGWTCELQQSLAGPYWTVQPREGNHVLLAAHANLELVFENVVCDLGLDAQGDGDVTPMIVLWTNIPGCRPGSRCLPVLKTDELKIVEFASIPPFGRPVPWRSRATLSWRTLGAESSHLLDSNAPHALVDKVGDGPHEVDVVLDHVDPDRRFQVFAYRGSREVPSQAQSFAAIDYPPLRFSRPLSVSPSEGLTRVVAGITRADRPVVAPVQQLTLGWAVDFPQLVDGYTLYLNGMPWNNFPARDIALVDGQAQWPVDFSTQDQHKPGRFEFKLVAHALHGPSESDPSSVASFELFDPFDGLVLDIVPVAPTRSVQMAWGSLLHNYGNSCRCEFRVSSDPAKQGAKTWKIQFAENDEPGKWQCVLSDNQGSKTVWQRELGTSVKVTWPALHLEGRASDSADFFFKSVGGGIGVVQSVYRYLVGMRLQWPADTTSVSIPGDSALMRVTPFTLVVTQGLQLRFEGDSKPFTVYHNHHWTSGFFNQNDHDDAEPNTTGQPAFYSIDAASFPHLVASGRFEFTNYDGRVLAHIMNLTIDLGRPSSASLSFDAGSGPSHPVALTVIPPG